MQSDTFGFIGKEAIDFGNCSVESENLELVVRRIHDEILAHDGQANEAEIGTVEQRG